MQPVIGRKVRVVVDRPMGSRHPKHENILYTVNYGYVPGVIAPDGEEQDAYILGPQEPLEAFDGIVTGVIHRTDDIEDKWIVEAAEGPHLSDDEILAAVYFQEQYFAHKLVRRNEIAVIGSANVDIHGAPHGKYLPEDSNPGTIRLSVGGVGCNIARNLAALGWHVRFITALGEDMLSYRVREELTKRGLDFSRAITVPGGATSTYLYVTDETGSMVSAVSDMEITNAMTPAALAQRLDLLCDGSPVVFDANLSAEAIVWLCKHVHAPMAADSVSAAKVARLSPALSKLDVLKCNRLEACYLAGTEDLEEAAKKLVAMGVRRAFITLGEQGVCCADESGVQIVPGVSARKVLDTTGAGDSFLAGAVTKHYANTDMTECARFAAATAALTCECAEAVHPEMSMENVNAMMQ